MKRKKSNYLISKMYCVKCGQEGIPVSRIVGHYKEPGHLKKLYCLHCKDTTNHIEIRPFGGDYHYEDFLLEQKYNNFDKEGNRKEPYRIFRGKLKQAGKI